MTDRKLIDPGELHNMLDCDFDAGKLYWKRRSDCGPRWNGRYAGKEAFTYLDVWGYYTGRIHRVPYRAHRVIWAMKHGAWPIGEIDHINGLRHDNRIVNLRDVTRVENAMNMKIRADNMTGYHGICWHPGAKKWMARCKHEYLGVFSNIQDAVAARKEAEKRLSFHENHGRIS